MSTFPHTVSVQDDVTEQGFVSSWNQQRRKLNEDMGTMRIELRSIARIEPTILSTIESGLGRLRKIEREFSFFDLDRQRLGQLGKIFEAMSNLCKQTKFEEKDRFCNQIDSILLRSHVALSVR